MKCLYNTREIKNSYSMWEETIATWNADTTNMIAVNFTTAAIYFLIYFLTCIRFCGVAGSTVSIIM